MKLNLLLEIDLPEEDETNASKDLLAFFQQHFNITGISNYDLHILSIRLVDTMAITELNFPEKLNKCMHDNGIYLISDLQNFKLSEIYDIINSSCTADCREKYISLIHNVMKKCGVSYNDINADLLIPIKDCGLSARTFNSLTRAGYIYLQDISHHTREQVSKTRNLGVGSQKELEEKMIEHGLWYSDK